MSYRTRKYPSYDAAVFHAQQCAEKYLKARLEEAAIGFARTHDLLMLHQLVVPVEPTWQVLQTPLAFLNPFAVAYRFHRGYAAKAETLALSRSCAIIVARPSRCQAAKRRTASSFQSTPVPMASSTIAMPFSTHNGPTRMGFHQSAYSSQCTVGVQHRRRALISGHRWLDMRRPFA